MPSFATGDNNLNVALTGLATALFPDAQHQLAAQQRRAAAGKFDADAEKTRLEAQLLGEQRQAQLDLAGPLGDQLVQQNLGGQPGISDVIAGPPTAGTRANESFLRNLPAALLTRDGNATQFADGLRTALGTAGVQTGPQDEDSLRRNALLLSGGAANFSGGDAITQGAQQGFLDDAQAASRRQALDAQAASRRQALDVQNAKLVNVPEGNTAVRSGTGAPVAFGAGAGPNTGGAGSAGGGARPFAGTGMDQQTFNLLNSVNSAIARGEPISPDVQIQYENALVREFGPRTERVPLVNPDTGNTELVAVQVQRPIPPSFFVPESLKGIIGSGSRLSAAAPAAVGSADTLTAPAAGASAAADSLLPGSLGVSKRSRGVDLQEAEARNLGFLERMAQANINLEQLETPGVLDFFFAAPKEGQLATLFSNQLASDDAREYMQAAQSFLAPMLRKDTGAAAPLHEFPQYWLQFIPMPGDPPNVLAAKQQQRATAMNSILNNLPPEVILQQAISTRLVTELPPKFQEMIAGSVQGIQVTDVAQMDEATIIRTLEGARTAGVKPPPEIMQAIGARLNQLGAR